MPNGVLPSELGVGDLDGAFPLGIVGLFVLSHQRLAGPRTGAALDLDLELLDLGGGAADPHLQPVEGVLLYGGRITVGGRLDVT